MVRHCHLLIDYLRAPPALGKSGARIDQLLEGADRDEKRFYLPRRMLGHRSTDVLWENELSGPVHDRDVRAPGR